MTSEILSLLFLRSEAPVSSPSTGEHTGPITVPGKPRNVCLHLIPDKNVLTLFSQAALIGGLVGGISGLLMLVLIVVLLYRTRGRSRGHAHGLNHRVNTGESERGPMDRLGRW
jgi:hypothetical protein